MQAPGEAARPWGEDAHASAELSDTLHQCLVLVQIKNLLPDREVVLGNGRGNRARYHVLLMKFCCDASAAELNGGRFKTSHIRLSVSELICTVISTPFCAHTHQNQQLFLPDHPSSHFAASWGSTCSGCRGSAALCVLRTERPS